MSNLWRSRGFSEEDSAMERPAREKRGLDTGDGDRLQPETKRSRVPALASVIVEALKVDSLQKICSSLEPILRRVVSEEVERALSKLAPSKIGGRSSPKRIEGPDGRNLRLCFRTRLSLPLFTGGKVEGEQGAAIHVVLIDANTGHIVSTGPESSAKLDILVLEGDFNKEDDDDWTEEEFENHVVKEREGKRPLLTGDLQITMKEGVGTLGDLTFTDNSSWIRSRKFRLGVKIASGFCEDIRIREAKTDAFTVKDHRGELYKKHYPPALTDEVWRLEKIGKDGSFHKKLNKYGIFIVEDFLKLVVRDPQRLRTILGSGMSNRMWESLVEHAKTCVLGGKYYIYYPDETRSIGAIFNNIYEFCGLIALDQFYSAENLTDAQKVFVDTLVKKAYDNWIQVIEYDGRALLSFTKNNKEIEARNEAPSTSANYHGSYDKQASQMNSQASAPSEQSSVDVGVVTTEGGITSVGYTGNQVDGYPNHSRTALSDNSMDFANTSFRTPNQSMGSTQLTQETSKDNIGLALTPPQQTTIKFQPLNESLQQTNLSVYDDWSHQRDSRHVEDYFSEEIRLRSHEIIENEDMQQLLHVYSLGGVPLSTPEDGYGFSSFMQSPCPTFNFDDDRNRSSGRAVVGWLKIKAAMRWGIFIRKKAAEKRAAQLVEIEDD